MMVRCYWNLHKGCWSVQDAKTRRVIGHASRVLLDRPTFKVSAAGRERVRREGKKNVHAFACGGLLAAVWLKAPPVSVIWDAWDEVLANRTMKGLRVTYNPYVDEGFVYAAPPRAPVVKALELGYLADRNVWVVAK